MTQSATQDLCRLLADLPPIEADTELIVRPDDHRPIAVLRPAGRPPRVFELADDGVRELVACHDDGLPGRALIGAGAEATPALRATLPGCVRAELVAWRPRRRAVLRLQFDDGAVAWLKLLDRKNFARAARGFAGAGPAAPGLRFVLPVWMLPDACACVAADAGGCSLQTHVGAGRAVPFPLLVRGLQQLAATAGGADLPSLDFGSARAAAIDMLHKGAQLRHELLGLAALVSALRAPPAAPTQLVHGDLHDKQVFLADGELRLIDLEGLARGDARFDRVNLAEHLRLRDLQRDGHDRGLGDELLEQCGHARADPGVRAFRAVVRARLCGVYALRPRWLDLCTRLADETHGLIRSLR